jgi:hypothetical protein
MEIHKMRGSLNVAYRKNEIKRINDGNKVSLFLKIIYIYRNFLSALAE